MSTSPALPAEEKTKGMMLHYVLMGLVSLGIIATLQSGFIFFITAMLPTIVSFYMDVTQQKHVYKTILACNLCGIAPTLSHMVNQGSTAAAMQQAMFDPFVWLSAYGAAAAGWVLLWICEYLARVVVFTSSKARVILLKMEQDKLIKEWGDGIKN